jgi:hypothetical protein
VIGAIVSKSFLVHCFNSAIISKSFHNASYRMYAKSIVAVYVNTLLAAITIHLLGDFG